MFGRDPNLPGDLLNEPIDMVPATAGLTETAVAKALAVRQTARAAASSSSRMTNHPVKRWPLAQELS